MVTQFAEGLFLGFFVLSGLVVAFFPKRGRPGRATLFLLGTIMLALTQLWLLSVTCREAGVSPEVGANVLLAVVISGGCGYWGFIATIARGMPPRVLAAPMACELVIAASLLVWPDAVAVLVPASAIVGVFAGGVVCWLLFGAIRARTPGAIPIAIGSECSPHPRW